MNWSAISKNREIIENYLEGFDHAMCINTMDPAYPELRARYGDRVIAFENEDPTTEVLARVIFDKFSERLADYAAKMNLIEHVKLVPAPFVRGITQFAAPSGRAAPQQR